MRTLGINEMVWIAEIIELDDSPHAIKQQKIANYMNCSFYKAGKLYDKIKENLEEGKKLKAERMGNHNENFTKTV